MTTGRYSEHLISNDIASNLRDEFVIPTNRTIKATAVPLDLRSSLDVLPLSALSIT